jgi:iron complex outermembrane receptor protein
MSRRLTVDEGDQRTLTLRLSKREYALDEVVVSATRSEEALGRVASSVSVLSNERIETQSALTSDLGNMLAQEIPGLAPSNESLSNFGQTLRGRSPFIMIDGVPQNTPLRDALRSLRTVGDEAIERIEVVRGASALYGYGATGGAINIITKQPTPELEATTEVGVRGSGADLSESFTGRLHQSISGTRSGVEYVASGSYERWGQFYDGDGNLIAQDPRGQGGLAGADEISVLGKVGGSFAPKQHLTGSVSYYSFLQNMEYERQSGVYGETPTSAVAVEDVPGKDPGTQNLVGRVRYEHDDVVGSELTAQAYVQDFKTRFGYADFYPDGGGQGFVRSNKQGLRLDIETPFPDLDTDWERAVTWGVDVLRDETAQELEDGRTFAPEMTQTSAAPFAQVRFALNDRLTLRGGVRYETLSLQVDGFTTLFGGNEVTGGTLNYDNTAVNAGLVYAPSDPVELFLSFDQGFSASDIGRVLRSTGAASVEQVNPEAKTVNSYEVGGQFGTSLVNLSVTGFYNTSELGSSYGDLPELELIRSPERVYGAEVTTDVQLLEPLAVGGTFTWLEGKRDATGDGNDETYLPGERIPPAKTTGYVELNPSQVWSGRVQVMHVGSRDRFDDDTYGHGSIAAYTLVDLQGRVAVGPGALRVGVKNLFDVYYFPVRSQFGNFDDGYTPGRGRTVSLSYTVTW